MYSNYFIFSFVFNDAELISLSLMDFADASKIFRHSTTE